MSDNPYASIGQTQPKPLRRRKSPQKQLILVAICLIALGAISLLVHLISIVWALVYGQLIAGKSIQQIVGIAFLPICNLVVLAGGILMLNGKSYASCMTASIIAVIPICTPCFLLGIPFGIWALFVLNQQNVRAVFRS